MRKNKQRKVATRLEIPIVVKSSSPIKTKPPRQNQQFVAKTQANEVGRAAIAKMNVAKRSLCKEHNIKWRNARGSKHLTKTEMFERLSA
jgi:hypothetical protein